MTLYILYCFASGGFVGYLLAEFEATPFECFVAVFTLCSVNGFIGTLVK